MERPAGEMTWNECVAMGQLLKAQRLAQQQQNRWLIIIALLLALLSAILLS